MRYKTFFQMKWLQRLAAVSLVFVAACSTVTTQEAMTVSEQSPVQSSIGKSVALMVSGESSLINQQNFLQALEASITSRGLFESVDNSGAAAHLLSVEFKEVDTPMFGAGFTIGVDTVWTLYRSSDREKLISEEINSVYEGGAFEGGFFGANRVRVATEGAAKENIQLGLEKLTDYSLMQVVE